MHVNYMQGRKKKCGVCIYVLLGIDKIVITLCNTIEGVLCNVNTDRAIVSEARSVTPPCSALAAWSGWYVERNESGLQD